MEKRNSAHINAQKAARIRDNNLCQICGSRDHTAGHHAVDYQYGGSSSLDNIVTLCRGCHRRVHKGEMDVYSV
ncbi:HNH endonuclease [Butyrivibrio sp. YAB3001]|uniref:HNH endonuclease n=1 Tax=Butyrivibrio sp. YAB3001 TaxID=1520812 RepID=UPI0008F64432|nr:HNH endonuclease [Butyrivibrio sp. YAB3001]SFB66462.1 HNH endonuclease [Butyrivibrio sp. YAB3001]